MGYFSEMDAEHGIGIDGDRITQIPSGSHVTTTRVKPSVTLIGEDGNIFALLGAASRALKDAGQRAEAREMQTRVLSAGSYDNAIVIILTYVDDAGHDETPTILCPNCQVDDNPFSSYDTCSTCSGEGVVAADWFDCDPSDDDLTRSAG